MGNQKTIKRKKQRHAKALLAKGANSIAAFKFLNNEGTLLIGLSQNDVKRTTVAVVEAVIKRNLMDSLIVVDKIEYVEPRNSEYTLRSHPVTIDGALFSVVTLGKDEEIHFLNLLEQHLVDYLSEDEINKVLSSIEVRYFGILLMKGRKGTATRLAHQARVDALVSGTVILE